MCHLHQFDELKRANVHIKLGDMKFRHWQLDDHLH
jgi:hypothetical protein